MGKINSSREGWADGELLDLLELEVVSACRRWYNRGIGRHHSWGGSSCQSCTSGQASTGEALWCCFTGKAPSTVWAFSGCWNQKQYGHPFLFTSRYSIIFCRWDALYLSQILALTVFRDVSGLSLKGLLVLSLRIFTKIWSTSGSQTFAFKPFLKVCKLVLL